MYTVLDASMLGIPRSLAELAPLCAARGIAGAPVRTGEFTGKRMTFFADPDGLPLEIRE